MFSVLLAFRNFVGNFVDGIRVWEKTVKLGKVFEVRDEVTKVEKGPLNKYQPGGLPAGG